MPDFIVKAIHNHSHSMLVMSVVIVIIVLTLMSPDVRGYLILSSFSVIKVFAENIAKLAWNVLSILVVYGSKTIKISVIWILQTTSMIWAHTKSKK